MFNFLSKLFPSKHEKDVKEILPYIGQINEFYEEYKNLSDDELRAKTTEFKELIKS